MKVLQDLKLSFLGSFWPKPALSVSYLLDSSGPQSSVPYPHVLLTFMSFLQLKAEVVWYTRRIVKHLDVNLNWLNCFHLLILLAVLLVLLIKCMIFVSSFLVVTRISMSTVPFLEQLEPRVLYPQCALLWSKI